MFRTQFVSILLASGASLRAAARKCLPAVVGGRATCCGALFFVPLLSASCAFGTTIPATVLYTNSTSPLSLRGLALSNDGSQIYAGFISPASGTAIREISTSGGTVTASTTISGSFTQPKGLGVDPSGNVWTTLNNSSGSTSQQFRAYSGALNSTLSTTALPVTSSNTQLWGATVATIGGNTYLYVTGNKGGTTIERYNINNPSSPVLDSSFGTSGILNVGALVGYTFTSGANGLLNGLAVASDGTIYVAADLSSSSAIRGDTLLKIAPSLSTYTSTPVVEAMGVALYGSNVYVAQYNSTASSVAVLSSSNLTHIDTLTFSGVPAHSNTSVDSGYSNVAISASGTLYVADQLFTSTNHDQILVAHVPEPSTIVLAALGLLGLLAMRVKRSSARRGLR